MPGRERVHLELTRRGWVRNFPLSTISFRSKPYSGTVCRTDPLGKDSWRP